VLSGGIDYFPSNAFILIQPRTLGMSISRQF